MRNPNIETGRDFLGRPRSPITLTGVDGREAETDNPDKLSVLDGLSRCNTSVLPTR